MPHPLPWLIPALFLGLGLTGGERLRVLGGEVLVAIDSADPAQDGPPGVRGAIRIEASPAQVFSVMTSCAEALQYVPRLESCRVVKTAADGSYALIEHEVNPRWYLPRIRFVFRADYAPPREIRMSNVSGGLREYSGRWTLEPLDAGTATLVEYHVRVVPRYAVPQWLVLATLKRDLPELLQRLAARCRRQG